MSRAGRPCARCGGSMFPSQDDDYRCIICGHVSYTQPTLQPQELSESVGRTGKVQRRVRLPGSSRGEVLRG